MILLARKEARERDIALFDTMKKKSQQECLSMDGRVNPVRVVKCFLGAGIPLLKVDSLRSLLDENGLKITHCSHLSNCIPPLVDARKG